MKQALEALESATPKYTRQRKDQKTLGGALEYWRLEQHQRMKAITALSAAIAEAEKQEPVIECDCTTEISPCGKRTTYCGSDQMRRAAEDGSAFAITLPAAPVQEPVTYPPCKGMNCGCTDGVSHSAECQAEHAAAIAGGQFVKLEPTPPAAQRQRAVPEGYALVDIQALKRWGVYDYVVQACQYPITAPSQRQPEHEGCACRWDGDDNRVVTCERHQGWLDVIAEWADRAREAEAKLKATPLAAPVQEPVAWNSGVPPLHPKTKDGETISVEYVDAAAPSAQQEPCAMRYDFDGYGYKYIDSGSGSDWKTRIKGAEPLYEAPPQRQPLNWEPLRELWRKEQIDWDALEAAVKAAHGIGGGE